MIGPIKPLPLGVDETARSAGEGALTSRVARAPQRSPHPNPLPEGEGAGAGEGKSPPARYVVVCRGPNCRARGSLPLRKRLAELLRREQTVRLVGYACFGQCDFGPNVAFYPEGTWYGDLSAPDAAERVARHALGLECLDTPPLSLPEPERSEHLHNIAELVRTLERDQRRQHHWWWPF